MKKKIIQLSLLLFFFLGILSCKNKTEEVKVKEPEVANVVINNSKDLVEATIKEIDQITPKQLKSQKNNEGTLIIDVREKGEFDAGNIPGSVLIPRGLLEFRIGSSGFWESNNMEMPHKGQKIIIYCAHGARGSLATKSLNQMGYKNVVNLEGGFHDWEEEFPEDISIPKPTEE
ncbi:hypothetical protein MNBD_BACTEROID02-1143 [hydrothermal vent metagenome]|uniref:Rhodanese domain-containing protein n=1 Tax=hydrothermal vent metagenome TaxID=652676 RepID=A0A3B0QXC2_9ZZZZ